MDNRIIATDAQAVALKLLNYCRANDWAGYDPYDALNSRVFAAFPSLNSKLLRLILTQVGKRSPLNLRRLAGIPKTQDPKALALSLAAALTLPRLDNVSHEDLLDLLTDRLIGLRSRDTSYWCWGYSFPWQTRAKMVPRGAPNLVCTSFVAGALLDAYEQRRASRYLNMAASAANYIKNELYWTDGDANAGFSYPLPSLRTQVHNANFLGAALLTRVAKHTGDKTFLGPALRVARYSTAQQNDDGSWYYGESGTARWIDNFHTGYNLCALRSIGQAARTTEFESCLRRGLEFYRTHFFREDGAVRYFHNRTYPVDIHSVAQSIITLLALKDLNPGNVSLAHSVLRWTMSHMWDDRGFFYYRVHRLCTVRTSYLRWSQAWMLLALATFLGESNVAARDPQMHNTIASA